MSTSIPNKAFTEQGRQRLIEVIQEDIERKTYDGICIKIAHHGETVFDEAIGFAHRASGRRQKIDDIFFLFSITKSITNVAVFQAIDRGRLALTTPVVEVIPEFWGVDPFIRARRGKVNVLHLLTHTAGLPPTVFPVGPDEYHDAKAIVAAACRLQIMDIPGTTASYSSTLNHTILGEMVSRTDPAGRSYTQIVREDILEPLGMKDSFFGFTPSVSQAQIDRIVPLFSVAKSAGWSNDSNMTADDVLDIVVKAARRPDAEMPCVGLHSTTEDMLKFAEMLRNWGTTGDKALVSPAILDKANRVWTGSLLNDLFQQLPGTQDWDLPPANYGLGFAIGGSVKKNVLGTLSSAGAFGGHGHGTTLWWTDRERALSFVLLGTGAMDEAENYGRYQRLSDLVLSALR